MRRNGAMGRSTARFGADRRGNFAIIFGMVVAVLALAVGFGVDTAQLMNAKSALQNAVDSAVTSTARDLTTGSATEEEARKTVSAFLTANSAGGALPYDKIVLDKLVIDRAAKTVTASAYVDVPLYFALFGQNNVKRIHNTGAAVYSDKHIEVAMMLDVTGSMGGQKIKDLKTAATNAVEALFKNQNPSNPRVRAAIIPYAEAVNTGLLADTVFIEQKGGADLPPPDDQPILASAASSTRPDKCATERKDKDGAADFTDDGPYTKRNNNAGKIYTARINRDDRISLVKDGRGVVVGTKCPKAEVIPLTTDKQKLLDTITDFAADGVTAGGIAAQWGYYMLSPKWRAAIQNAGAGDGPADFNKEKVGKVAILMTDGQFNTAFAGVPVSNNSSNQPQNDQGAKARIYAESICANMKRDGIEVYTIGFALSSKEQNEARAVLQNCATKDTSAIRHFFDVSTGPELDAAFTEIIANTERLALTR